MTRKIIPRLNKDRRLCSVRIKHRNFQLLLRKPKKTKVGTESLFVTGYYGWFMVLLLAKKGDLLWNESY